MMACGVDGTLCGGVTIEWGGGGKLATMMVETQKVRKQDKFRRDLFQH